LPVTRLRRTGRGQEGDDDRQQRLLGRALHHPLDQRRRDDDAEDPAADEPHEAQQAHDEALAVPRDCEEHDQYEQDQIEYVVGQHRFKVPGDRGFSSPLRGGDDLPARHRTG